VDAGYLMLGKGILDKRILDKRILDPATGVRYPESNIQHFPPDRFIFVFCT